MKKGLRLVIASCLYTIVALGGGDPKFPVSEIPEALLKDVNAVVRENKIIFKILSQSKASVYSYYAITILDANGKKHATDVEFYDKLTKLTTFNASVYDANGKLIRKLKNSEIYDQSVYDGSTLFSDDRLKVADLSQSSYPYTVIFEYEKEYKYLYHIDGSIIVPDEKVSVQKSSYQLIFPASLAPRYKTFNIDSNPIKATLENGMESLLWTFENVNPIIYEALGNGWASIMPRIKAAPSHFEFEGYIGDMHTWEDYGKWIASLNKGRDVLPEATKIKIKEITANLKTTEEKIKAVYEYLQGRSRYVGIQLGIGGYQPFEASIVDKTGYGDCKALSNYTVALLKEIGIKAHYVLIMAGPDALTLQEEFPSSQFNHATVCVPNGKDTVWLECTSQTIPYGYAGKFTGGRKALAITDNGATIVRTPVYTAEQNSQITKADVYFEMNGNAKTKTQTIYSGLQYENENLNSLLDDQYDDQKKWIQANTGIPTFDINSFSMKNIKDKIPSAIVNLDLTLNRLASVSGKRLFLTPNLMNRWTFIPERIENRKTNVVRKMAYIDYDTIRYHLPEEIYPEFLPEPIKIKSQFGEYESSFKLEQGNLLYMRRLKMNKGEFPPATYKELIDFCKSINKADNAKIVFLNKT